MWLELEKQAHDEAGITLFTVMRFDETTKKSLRFYSSDPENYPVSKSKPMAASYWYDQVIVNQEPFLANSLAELDAVFPDGDLIGSLGLGSCINIPMIENGQVVGTLNFLREEGGLQANTVTRLKQLVKDNYEGIIDALKAQEV